MLCRRSFLMGMGPLAFALPGVGAPDFRGTTLDGVGFTKASLRGKPVLIQFWATWCGYCRRDQPAVEEIVEDFRGRLVVLAVSVDEAKETVQRYLKRSPRKSKIVLTQDTNLAAVFGARGFPYYVLLDAEGKVIGDQRGSAGREGLRQLLERAGLRE